MLAMRRLQRAVNNKDKDIQNLKADFEKNKKILDTMVKEIKEKEDSKNSNKAGNLTANAYSNPNHFSIIMNGNNRDNRFGVDSQER